MRPQGGTAVLRSLRSSLARCLPTCSAPGLSRKGWRGAPLPTDRALARRGRPPVDRGLDGRLPRARSLARQGPWRGRRSSGLLCRPLPAAWVLAPRKPFAPEAAQQESGRGSSDRAWPAQSAVLSMQKPRLP